MRKIKLQNRLQNSRYFFSKSVKRAVAYEPHKPAGRPSFQTFCGTARAYLNTQKYGLFSILTSENRREFTR